MAQQWHNMLSSHRFCLALSSGPAIKNCFYTTGAVLPLAFVMRCKSWWSTLKKAMTLYESPTSTSNYSASHVCLFKKNSSFNQNPKDWLLKMDFWFPSPSCFQSPVIFAWTAHPEPPVPLASWDHVFPNNSDFSTVAVSNIPTTPRPCPSQRSLWQMPIQLLFAEPWLAHNTHLNGKLV